MQRPNQNHNYIEILKDSLKKKQAVLEDILERNEEQKLVIQAEKFDEEKFDVIYEAKGKLIAELELLDSGFQSVYDRVSEVLSEDKELYKSDIQMMQTYIKNITELSMRIQASEARNKEMMDKHTEDMRKDVKVARQSTTAASQYYYNMARLNVVDPQFMDKKK